LYEKEFALDDPLPEVSIENLEKIERLIQSSIPHNFKKDKVIHQLLKDNVFDRVRSSKNIWRS